MSNKEVDNVNHPQHYEGHTSLECIEVMRVIFGDIGVCYFCLCNSFKYLWRYKNKNGAEDIKKAKWYLNYVSNLFSRNDIESPKIKEVYDRVAELFDSIKMKGDFPCTTDCNP